MDRIQIRGGARLNGVIPISGAKNAALPLMIASLMTDQTLTLENLPRLADVAQLAHILGNHGVDYSVDGKRIGEEAGSGQTAHLRARTIVDTTAPYEMVAKMRASFWVIAPLLARMGAARVSLPGGCAIGTRPVDLLLMALEKLGARIDIDGGYAVAKAPKGLIGAEIEFPKVTVGGTHVAMMAASTAHGATLIRNAAREPEVADLAACLNKMGARIRGAGSSTIEIEGVARLNGAHHRVLPDRIEAGTYATAVAMTGGDLMLEGVGEGLLQEALEALTAAGATVTSDNRGVRVRRIKETIFENRFMHVQELARLGASIKLEGDTAIVSGVKRLRGAPVMATDLRASVSLVIAGLAAEGETIVNRIYHLDRGFERLEEKLGACGADIARLAG